MGGAPFEGCIGGSCENNFPVYYEFIHNGLIREYIPKKSKFDTVNTTQIVTIQNKLNNRPRKVLKFYTPNEVFFKEFLRKKVA